MEDVSIRDVDIPFRRLVFIMVKLAIASIPAIMILALIQAIILGIGMWLGGNAIENMLF